MASSAQSPNRNRLGLTDEELGIVRRLLSTYVPDRPVWAFGSRAFGRARRRSDLDLAIGLGDGGEDGVFIQGDQGSDVDHFGVDAKLF